MATDPYAGLDTRLAAAVRQLIAATQGRVRIVSGYRTREQQAALYANRASSPYPVAAPGTSAHERGDAVDLGGDLALARQLAPQFGLTNPTANDPVHFELARQGANMSTSAASGRYPGFNDRYQVWTEAGGPSGADGWQLGTFAASVSKAENSTGGADVISKRNNDGSVDVGLWQINSSHVGTTLVGPDGKPFTIQSIAWLQDPINNAKAAYALSRGGHDWHPWCTAWSDNACGTKGGKYLERGSRAVETYDSVLGVVTSGSGLAGILSLGAAGPGATQLQGPQPGAPPGVRTACDPGVSVWKVGPWTVLNQCQAQSLGGSLLMIAGGFVMLTGTIVILFRFQATRGAATAATAAVPIAGPAVSTIAGRGGGPGPARRRASRSAADTQRRRDEERAAGPQRAYDTAKAREAGRQAGRYSREDAPATTHTFADGSTF